MEQMNILPEQKKNIFFPFKKGGEGAVILPRDSKLGGLINIVKHFEFLKQ